MEDKTEVLRYIKQMTSIPNEFIDDLFQFYANDTLQTDFVIDLDSVSKWFETPKHVLLSTLRKSRFYKEDLDYKYFSQIRNPKSSRANNYKHVRLTPDCFKQLAMSTRSKKGHLIRAYFIEIENLFIKYRKQLLSGMEMEIKQLSLNQKPLNAQPKAGYVYVIRASEKRDSVYKIGRTTDLHARLRSHQSALADDLSILEIYRTDNVEAVESCTHAWLKPYKYRKYKEIFQIDIDTIKHVIAKCGAVGNAVIKLKSKESGKTYHKGGLYLIASKDSL